jgi:hypothetical protein
VIHRPTDIGAFQFVVLATLRAAQLMRGCRPRVDATHKATVTAQLELAGGRVSQAHSAPTVTGDAGSALLEQTAIIGQPT